jgi:hypothetical protein
MPPNSFKYPPRKGSQSSGPFSLPTATEGLGSWAPIGETAADVLERLAELIEKGKSENGD